MVMALITDKEKLTARNTLEGVLKLFRFQGFVHNHDGRKGPGLHFNIVYRLTQAIRPGGPVRIAGDRVDVEEFQNLAPLIGEVLIGDGNDGR